MSVSITQRSGSSTSIALSEVIVNTGNGSGSTNTVIRRFSVTESNVGSDITYADSATNGASFTVNATGIYGMSYTDENSGTATLGISRNSNQLTTSIASITTANEVVLANMVSGNPTNVGAQISLNSGDVIRPHNGTGLNSTSTYVKFRIIRLS